MERRTKSIFSLSLVFSLSLSRSNREEREREKFEILSHRRTRTACCSLAYRRALDSGASYMKFQNRRVKHDEEKGQTNEREREREAMDNGVRD